MWCKTPVEGVLKLFHRAPQMNSLNSLGNFPRTDSESAFQVSSPSVPATGCTLLSWACLHCRTLRGQGEQLSPFSGVSANVLAAQGSRGLQTHAHVELCQVSPSWPLILSHRGQARNAPSQSTGSSDRFFCGWAGGSLCRSQGKLHGESGLDHSAPVLCRSF